MFALGRSLRPAVLVMLLLVSGAVAGIAAPASAPTCSLEASTAAAVLVDLDDIQPMLEELYALYEGLPGFIDVYYTPGAEPPFRPMFVREVPAEALDASTPVPVAFDVLPEEPMPVQGPGVPDAGDVLCDGIRPGAPMSGPAGCTFNWVFTNGTDFFIGTAGHCISKNQRAFLPGVGDFGVAVFSINQGVGRDFALVKVDAAFKPQVTGEMCHYAGPTGVFGGPTLLGRVMLQTGHGLSSQFGAIVPPRAKIGVGQAWGAASFTYQGASLPGDSGSPVRVNGGLAVGVLTHIAIPTASFNFGTTIQQGLSLAGMSNLQLVTVSHVHGI